MRRWLHWTYFSLQIGLLSTAALATTITHDEGGNVNKYVQRVRTEPGPIRVDGGCFSSCTMFLARRDLCATDGAVFVFHQAFWPGWFGTKIPAPRGNAILMAHYPAKVRAWIKSQGGLPLYGHLRLQGAEMRSMVKACHT